MINLLISIIIFVILAGLLYWLIGLLPLPEQLRQVVQVCMVLVCILLIVGIMFGGISLPMLR